MRILVLLDPTNKRGTKMAYTALRNFLFSDGYLRIGTELFMRITPSRKTVPKNRYRTLHADHSQSENSRKVCAATGRTQPGNRGGSCNPADRKAI